MFWEIESFFSSFFFLERYLCLFRIAAVCDFLTYCRYVTQGLVKAHCNEVYWEIMLRRRNMAIARLGFLN